MEFWLSFNNGAEKLQLPVPPNEFEVQTGLKNTVVNVNDSGDINLIGKRELDAISLSSFFPAQEYPFCQYRSFPPPYDCVQKFKSWMRSQKPIRLIITGTDINHAMAIESFKYGEKDGSGDVYFNLELKEYRFLNIEAVNAATASDIGEVQMRQRPTEKEAPTSYTVKPGDTLWAIAKKVYGDGSKWSELAKKNGIKDPRKLWVGQTMVV